MVEQQPEQTGDVKNIRRFVAFVGIFLLLLSQFLVFSQPIPEDIVLPPYLGYAVFGVIVMILSQFIPSNAFWIKLSSRPVFRDRVFWIFVASLLAIVTVVALNAFMIFRRLNFIPLVTIWLLGGACYVYAFVNFNLDFVKVKEWLKTHRNEVLTVLFVIILAAIPRFYLLGQLPRVLDGDEGSVGNFARATVNGVLMNPFALWENFGALYLQLINISMRLFGYNAFGLRLLPAIGGVLAIPAVYLFARWVGGKRIALIAAVMIAISHSHLHFSRISSVAYIQDAWLIPLELYFLISGLEKRQSWRTALSGVLLAIHYSVYLTSQIITGLVLIYMLILFIFYRTWFTQRLSQAFAFWGGFLLSILPSALFAYYNPNEFMNRLGSSGTFQTGYVQNVMSTTGQSAFEVLVGRVVHAFLSLFYYPALDFYGSPSPMMSMISGVMLLAGLGIILWQIRKPAYLLLNGYIWGSAVAIGVFATPPSADSYRMLMALPAAVIIAAIGIDKILEIIGLSWANARQAYTFTVTALLTSLLFFNLWTYYAEFAGQCRFAADLAGRFATYLGVQLQEIDNENRVYMLSDEYYFHGSHPSTLFLSLRPVINFKDPIDTLDAVSGETIIAPPSRIEELEAWARTHPGGQLHYEYDCTTTILLSYQVP
ncbi:MAG: glycosyltransferase family 39 protein [Anaerolineales bacterium]|nr:glycosyltransferase family 39 protein [Anaerolineales bacterium]MBX3036533.1 glycosyltransferase family 39 protein [Anaerolineales bacterium]